MNPLEEKTELLEIVRRLEDKNLQEKGWFGLIPNTYVSYFETVPHFLDLAPDILANPDKYSLSFSQVEVLKKLIELVEEFDVFVYKNYQSLENPIEKVFNAILNDPKWHEIRDKANTFLRS